MSRTEKLAGASPVADCRLPISLDFGETDHRGSENLSSSRSDNRQSESAIGNNFAGRSPFRSVVD